jgi:hypothetical protein
MRLLTIAAIVVSSVAYAFAAPSYIYTAGSFSPPTPLALPNPLNVPTYTSEMGEIPTGITSNGIVFGLTIGIDITETIYYDPTNTFAYGGFSPGFAPNSFRVLNDQFTPYVSPDGYVAGTVLNGPGAPGYAKPFVLYAPDGTQVTVSSIFDGSNAYDQFIVGGVNDSGEVVGEERNSEYDGIQQPFIYDDGGVYELNSLVVNPPAGGFDLEDYSNGFIDPPLSIDDNGVVYGDGFKLTPTPEPVMLPILGMSFLLLRRHRGLVNSRTLESADCDCREQQVE